jgi:hypothetical protein
MRWLKLALLLFMILNFFMFFVAYESKDLVEMLKSFFAMWISHKAFTEWRAK